MHERAVKTGGAASSKAGSAEEILRWAADRFAPRLTFATSLGIEDCVVTDLIARALAAGRALHARHRPAVPGNLRAVDADRGAVRRDDPRGAARRTPSRSRRGTKGRRCGSASPIAAAICGRCSRCARRSPNYDAWITAIRRDQTPERANAPVVGWDGRFGLVKVNPLVRWTFDEVRAYVARARGAVQPAPRSELPEHRLHAVHEPGRARRGSAVGPLARQGKDRVRPALRQSQNLKLPSSPSRCIWRRAHWLRPAAAGARCRCSGGSTR